MEKVLHGRRKGKERMSPVPHAEMKFEPPDLSRVTVLRKADWDRIQNQLKQRSQEEERVNQIRAEKIKLRDLSRAQVKNWTNTIVGQRQKKLEARAIREKKEEEERKAVDLEEVQFQSVKRREAIERAKTQQYYQTDRVKGFHGALLLTEVLKEREAQIELKHLRERANDGKDARWVELDEREFEEGILRDQQEAAERIRKVNATAEFQKQQIREHLNEVNREQSLDRVEGHELKRLAAHYELEKRRLDQAKDLESKELLTENLRQIDDVHRMRHIVVLQEEEEDEECRIFAAAKRKMMKLRSEKERTLHDEKQQRLDRIRETLHAQMQERQDDEDTRISRAHEENEAKRADEEQAKESKNRKAQHEMAEHRNMQMRENEQKIREERKQEFEMQKVHKQADAQFHINEGHKNQRRQDINLSVQNYHQKQIDERRSNEENQRRDQLQQDKRNEEFIAMEESQFQEYANQVIEKARQGGRTTIPLQKAALEGAGGGLGPVFPGKGGVRPSYMVSDNSGVQLPNFQRSTTDETKHSGQTNKRLGFVW